MITISNNQKRLTIVITPEIEPLLDEMKKEKFYNCSRSEMIRTLVETGYGVIEENKGKLSQKIV